MNLLIEKQFAVFRACLLLLVGYPLTPVFAIDILHAIRTVADPMSIVHKAAAEKIAKAVGVNPQTASKLADPAGVVIEHGPAAVKDQLDAELNRAKSTLQALREGKPQKILLADLRHSVDTALNPEVMKVTSSAAMLALAPGMRDILMEKPDLTTVNPMDYSGSPVVYVNGIARSKDDATAEAEFLSVQLKRPVQLLYNGTHGWAGDVVESALDRFEPLFLGKFDSTSRQLAYLFYNSPGPVNIVSHSQGCILVRNGLMIAESYKPVTQKVAWVATGTPMRDEEVFLKTAKFHSYVNPSDTIVGQLIGLKFDENMLEKPTIAKGHDFVDSYVSQISDDDFLPGGSN